MDQDFPWWLLAFVIIGFLRWLINKLQGGEREEEKLSEFEEIFLEQEKEAQREEIAGRQRGEKPSKGMPPPVLTRGRDPEDEIRKFFEALGGGGPTTEAPPPVVREERRPAPPAVPTPPPVPPPVPRKKTVPSPVPDAYATKPLARRLTSAESEALVRVRERGAATSPRGADTRPASAIRKLLRSSGGLKSAVLLKEILDQPKGLKDAVESHTF